MATILYVDDEPAIGLILEDTLERAGHTTIGAHSVPQALQALRGGSVDLVISSTDLDFGHMRDVLPNIFSSVGKWSSFMELVQTSAPRSRERKQEAKKVRQNQCKPLTEVVPVAGMSLTLPSFFVCLSLR